MTRWRQDPLDAAIIGAGVALRALGQHAYRRWLRRRILKLLGA